mgnify:CR=1 FL=1
MKSDNFYIYGRNAVLEALESGQAMQKVYVMFGAQGGSVQKVFVKAKKNKIQCAFTDKKKFQELEKTVCGSPGKSQGVIALINPFEIISTDEFIKKSFLIAPKPVAVILDGISDPHNLGAIARSAECSGAAGIILSERNSAPVTPAAVKVSAGALGHLFVANAGNLIQAIGQLKAAGYWIVGADDSADKLYTAKIYDSPIAVIIGNEGKGISPSLKKHCDFLVKIPLKGKVTSLNASVASGIILFEILRQRNQ